MKFLILGAGALGCLFGAKLASSSHDVIAIGSKDVYQNILRQDMIYENKQYRTNFPKNFHFFDKSSFYNSFLRENPSFNFDHCIIACKAYSLNKVLEDYHRILKGFPRIFLLQNGLGNEEIIHNKIPHLKVYRIISSMGAELRDHHQLIQTGEGTNYICYISSFIVQSQIEFEEIEPVRNFTNLLNEAGIFSQFTDKSLEKLWEKALVNMVINPLGALWKKRNGELLVLQSFWEIANDLIAEILMIMDKYGISIKSKKELIQQIKEILELTKANHNSMLQDLKRQKKTEIGFLNGRIIELASKLGISAPINKMIVYLIKGLE